MKHRILISTCAALLATSALQAQQVFKELDINNVQAGVHAEGNLFWDFGQGSSFQIPKGTGMGTIFSSTIWMGGLDAQNEIHLFGNRYWGSGADLRPGPLMDDAFYDAEAPKWDRVWKVSVAEIEAHLLNYQDPNYVMPDDIRDWPAHGSVSLGQAANLAPFKDWNNNGIYDPQNGDYPAIRGDQAIYFLLNDDWPHFATGAQAMNVQIAGMAYAFDCATNEALNNTIFFHYEISQDPNNSAPFHDTYLGLWVDFDIGNSQNDYVGCDVERSTFFGYNGFDLDPSEGGRIGYGDHPPAQGVVLLRGPMQDTDGLDNADGINAMESVNGTGYGDGVVDNERLGLTGFMHSSNNGGGGNPATNDPNTGLEYYYNMKNQWLDGTPLTHGGEGYDTDPQALQTRFAYPGDSDPQGYGTNGTVPQTTWTEAGNIPFDRRGLGISGPFTFEASEVIEFDYAFVYGRDQNGTALESVDAMKSNVDEIRGMFDTGVTACGSNFDFFTDVPQIQSASQLTVFPNPFADRLRINGLVPGETYTYRLTDPAGRLVRTGSLNTQDAVLEFSQLNQGLYLLEVNGTQTTELHRVVKR